MKTPNTSYFLIYEFQAYFEYGSFKLVLIW